jgi:hypothetical protein
MKKYIAVFFILMTVHLLTAQISTELMGGLDRSFRTISDEDNTFSSNLVFENREMNESARVQHRFGINALVPLTPSLYFKSGLRYAQTGYTLKTFEDGGIWPSEVDGGPDPFSVEELFEDHIFLEVPLQVRWSPLEDRLISPFVEVGVNPHIYFQTASTSVLEDGDRRTTITKKDDQTQQTFRDIYFVSVASIGAKIDLFKSVYVAAQVTGRYHLNTLGKEETPIIENHHSIGGELAVGYQFGG